MVEFVLPVQKMPINQLRKEAKKRGLSAARNWTKNDYRVALGYNATESKGKRQAPKSVTYSEDAVATSKKRRQLSATSRDQVRNHSLLAWMVRRHIDYVSQFHLMVKTGIPEVDKRLKDLFDWHGRPSNFDIAGRHGRNAAMRLFESGKILDGDCAFIKLDTGHLQAVEGDLIAKPKSGMPEGLEDRISDHGLILDDFGRMVQAVICKRGDYNSLHYASTVNAEDMLYDGYFMRFGQTRGISPLSTALNSMADLAEGFEHTLLKLKLHALLGVAIYRDEVDSDGFQTTASAGVDTDESGAQYGEPGYDIQLKPGLLTLDLDPGDRVDMMESKTPSSNFVEFSELMIRTVLLALDIPYTTFNSMASSFSARIADRVEYEESAAIKRKKNRYILQDYADWKINAWANVPAMLGDLMAKHNMNVFDLRSAVKWVPHGTPWLDKGKEVQGDQLAISIGLDSAPQAARRRGKDAYSIIDEQADFIEYAKAKGVPLTQGMPGQMTVEQIKQDEAGESGEADDERGMRIDRESFETLKAKYDAYGVGVRAGAITPQTADEASFRSESSLPEMSEAVVGAWDDDDGFRRPITLQNANGQHPAAGPRIAEPEADEPEQN